MVLFALVEQGLDVPPHVPVPLSQLHPLAKRQVVLDVLVEHAAGVPVQVAVEDQRQLLAERHVALIVIDVQGVAVPEQSQPLSRHEISVFVASISKHIECMVGRCRTIPCAARRSRSTSIRPSRTDRATGACS